MSSTDGSQPALLLKGTYSYKCAAASSGICVIGQWKDKEYIFAYLDPVRGRGKEITRVRAAEMEPFWDLSPDASKLAVLPRNASPEITTIALADGKMGSVKPTDTQWLIQNTCWSADGKYLYATGFSRDGKYALIALDASGKIKATEKSVVGWFFRPSCSPDAYAFAFNQKLFRKDLLLLEDF
jgi:hypothetical protein